MLKWARENGCPWSESTCSSAAIGGHIEILKWARENGCPWDSQTTVMAALCNEFASLKWAVENGCLLNIANTLKYRCDSGLGDRYKA